MRAVNMIWISFSMMSLTYHMQNYMAVLCEMPTIHYLARSPTVWPQYMYTKVTDRTDRQRLDRIGRTVLQTVAQNSVDRHTWHDLHVVSHLGFPMEVPPHVLSSESCDISDDYSLSLSSPPLASSQNNSSSTFPTVIRFLAIFLASDVHRVSTNVAVRSNVIPSHSWRQSINRPTDNK